MSVWTACCATRRVRRRFVVTRWRSLRAAEAALEAAEAATRGAGGRRLIVTWTWRRLVGRWTTRLRLVTVVRLVWRRSG